MTPVEMMRREIRDQLSHGMYADARLAAMIILAEPERIGDEDIGSFLLRVKCIRRETVMEWLCAAGVNPWRTGQELTEVQRRALAGVLIAFWKTEPARATA